MSLRGSNDAQGEARLGPPARFLHALLITLPAIVVAVVVGVYSVSLHRRQMQEEMRAYGRQRVLEIRTLGKKIYNSFMGPKIGGRDTQMYQASEERRKFRQHLLNIKETDPSIRAIAIFASMVPTSNPSGIVLCVGEVNCFCIPMNPTLDGEVLLWKGAWFHQGEEEEVLFLRAPIEGSGDQLTATANLVVSLQSFERESKKTEMRIILYGLLFVVASFVGALLWVSRANRRAHPNSDSYVS